MNQEIIDLYDGYTRGEISRRGFLDRLAKLAGGTAAAATLFSVLQNNNALAQNVPENDDRLVIETGHWEAGGAEMSGYLVRLKGGEKRPGVIVIHENRGLNSHIRDVARRMALEGFLTLAPDILSPMGGTPSNEDEARPLM